MVKVILDTDIGYDPDDFFALLLAWKLTDFDTDLIITADEVGGKRSIFLKTILEKLNWTKPKIAQGIDVGNKDFLVDGFINKDRYNIRKDFVELMKETIDSSPDGVVYVGIGGFTNLAYFLKKFNYLKGKLKVFMMGGAIDYSRYNGWVEHNIKIDIESARYVLESGLDISFVMAQTTFLKEYEVSDTSRIFKKIKQSNNPVYEILAENSELFNKYLKSKGLNGWSRMHDPLTLAVAYGKDFVTFHKSKVLMNKMGEMVLDKNGFEIKWSDPVSKHNEFMLFLEEKLFEEKNKDF